LPHIVLTVLAPDRPGLTEFIANAILSSGGNWLESHFSRLGGRYVGSVLIDVKSQAEPALETALQAPADWDLEVRLVPATHGSSDAGEALVFNLVGQDRPGIVRQVTTALSALEVNIEELTTRTENGPHSGAELFYAQAKLRVPSHIGWRRVQDVLEEISGEIMVDVAISPAPGPARP
jgi:glycine cleavage system regulatory protein